MTLGAFNLGFVGRRPSPAGGPETPRDPPANPRLSGESGAVALWLLGLCVVLLFLGGVSLDLWRAFTERRALAGLADAAAIAGASGLDEQAWRADQEVALDPPLAEQLATAHLATADTEAITAVQVAATAEQVTVELHGEVEVTLLRVLGLSDPLAIRVVAVAAPRASP